MRYAAMPCAVPATAFLAGVTALLAAMQDGSHSPDGLKYLSFAPEAGFGTASKDEDADNAQKENP